MSRRGKINPQNAALLKGQTFTTTVPFGGDLASMRDVIRHGESLTLTPYAYVGEVKRGDIVYVKWRGGNYLLHVAGEVAGDKILITNSHGGENGWVPVSDILAIVTETATVGLPNTVEELFEELGSAVLTLTSRWRDEHQGCAAALGQVLEGFRWYAKQMGGEWWYRAPRQDLWTFAQRLRYVTYTARSSCEDAGIPPCELVHLAIEQIGLLAQASLLISNPNRKHPDSWH